MLSFFVVSGVACYDNLKKKPASFWQQTRDSPFVLRYCTKASFSFSLSLRICSLPKSNPSLATFRAIFPDSVRPIFNRRDLLLSLVCTMDLYFLFSSRALWRSVSWCGSRSLSSVWQNTFFVAWASSRALWA